MAETRTKGTKETTAAKGTSKKNDTTTKEVTQVTKETTAKKNGNNGNHKRVVKLADMPVVKLTKKAFGELSPADLVAAMIDPKNPHINRIGRERAKALLVQRIEEERIKITEPEILMYLTFNSVRVKGVKTNAGFSEKNAKVKLTKAEFDKLTAKQKAAYVEKYSHKRRIADRIIPAYIAAGMPMTAEDVVYVTCGRVAVAGVTVQTASKTQPVPVKGVQFD